MPMQILPPWLTSMETLHTLIQLLQEKEDWRSRLKVRDFGPRVTDAELGQRLFSRVVQATAAVLEDVPDSTPRLVLTCRLSRLPRQAVILCLLLLPTALLLLYLSWRQAQAGAALWLVRTALLFLLLVPLLVYRRARLNIEHECGYVRDCRGQTAIFIDQLPSIQFQSYLAHEYAHHLYFELFGPKDEEWLREGWARLVQWQVVQHLWRREDNPAYLHHALLQIISELKFTCQIVSRTLHWKLPRRVQRIPSIYQIDPLRRLLTGTPGFDVCRLLEHAVGTAGYFLAAERLGPEKALQERAGLALDPDAGDAETVK